MKDREDTRPSVKCDENGCSVVNLFETKPKMDVLYSVGKYTLLCLSTDVSGIRKGWWVPESLGPWILHPIQVVVLIVVHEMTRFSLKFRSWTVPSKSWDERMSPSGGSTDGMGWNRGTSLRKISRHTVTLVESSHSMDIRDLALANEKA